MVGLSRNIYEMGGFEAVIFISIFKYRKVNQGSEITNDINFCYVGSIP